MDKAKKIHFVGIGNSHLAEVALRLSQLGHKVTASDPSLGSDIKDKLLINNIIDGHSEWSDTAITNDVATVVFAPGISSDNVQIKQAKSLNMEILSFPDFLYKLSEDKQRIVVIGSAGKTAIISMIVYVLDFHHRKVDYVLLSGHSKLPSIKLSDAPLIIIDGQDVTVSKEDSAPAFLKYRHHIGVISGIEWQRSDTYPTREEYTRQFVKFADSTPKGGIIVYFELDPVATALAGFKKADVTMVPYKTHLTDFQGGQEMLLSSDKKRIPLKISGKHNLQSISAAKEVLKKIGITSEMFYQAISSFEG